MTASPNAIVDIWRGSFPDDPPVGYVLRQIYGNRWIRFHTLPNDKRTPRTSADRQEVLDRLEKISDEIFSIGSTVIFFATLGEDDTASRMVEKMNLEKIHELPNPWVKALDDYVDTSAMAMICGTVRWKPHCVDELLLAAASDEIGSLTLFSSARDNVMCPYDGGVDLFVHDPLTRATITKRFSFWLPHVE